MMACKCKGRWLGFRYCLVVCSFAILLVCNAAFAGPGDARTWEEDFDTDPRLNTDDWQARGGGPNQAQFALQDGMAVWDGSASWDLVDSVDHYFNGETTIDMDFGPHPGDGSVDDRGVGWFLLAGNSSATSGTTGMILLSWSLSRDADGPFVQPNATVDGEPVRIGVAEGPVSTSVKVTVLGGSDGALVEYTVWDSNSTDPDAAPTTGSFIQPNRSDFSEGVSGFTFTSFSSGTGAIDYLQVVNDPNPSTEVLLGDVNLDGVINGLDVDPFVDVLLNGPYQGEADMNEDDVVNGLDVDPFVASVVGGGARQVPEPSTYGLAIIALGWFIARRRMRPVDVL